jgi:hypothetical protein
MLIEFQGSVVVCTGSIGGLYCSPWQLMNCFRYSIPDAKRSWVQLQRSNKTLVFPLDFDSSFVQYVDLGENSEKSRLSYVLKIHDGTKVWIVFENEHQIALWKNGNSS